MKMCEGAVRLPTIQLESVYHFKPVQSSDHISGLVQTSAGLLLSFSYRNLQNENYSDELH